MKDEEKDKIHKKTCQYLFDEIKIVEIKAFNTDLALIDYIIRKCVDWEIKCAPNPHYRFGSMTRTIVDLFEKKMIKRDYDE